MILRLAFVVLNASNLAIIWLIRYFYLVMLEQHAYFDQVYSYLNNHLKSLIYHSLCFLESMNYEGFAYALKFLISRQFQPVNCHI